KRLAANDRDLTTRTDAQLVALLDRSNVWYRRKARRLLVERHPPGISDSLRQTAIGGRGAAALEAMWAWYGCAGFDEATFERLLGHADADVRSWAVRLVGDEPRMPGPLSAKLVDMAGSEPDVAVRAQLACTARRLEPGPGLDVAHRLLMRDQDRGDP